MFPARAHHPRRRIAAVAALAMLASAAFVASAPIEPPGAGSPEVVPVDELPDAASAAAAAHAQGSPVRVGDLTAPDRVVYAQPDGTMTAELTAGPVRALREGEWVDIDTDLESRPDGTIAPKAAAADVTFSGGGADAPLVRFAHDGGVIELRWPEPLPEPMLSGDTATYPEVLPGVDLALRANAEGFAHFLVVKDRDAAANPSLERIEFDLSAEGVAVEADAEGRLLATADDGEVLFAAEPSSMWDTPNAAEDPLAGPGIGAAVAPVGVAVAGSTLALVPDRGLLTAEQAAYPVVIDPKWQTANRSLWGKVMYGKPTSSFPNGGDDGSEVKVGYCGWPGCAGIGAVRSHFKFDTRFLDGKTVVEAKLDTSIVYAPECSGDKSHGLYFLNRGGDQVWTTTTWNSLVNTPAVQVGTRQVSGPYVSCPGQESFGFDVTNRIKRGDFSSYFYRAVGTNGEADKYTWRKYSLSATKLRIEYNTPPKPPTRQSTDPPLPEPCHWCGSRPYFAGTSIRLRAQIDDAESPQVKAVWKLYGRVNDPKEYGRQPLKSPGELHSIDIDLSGEHGRTVSWAVWGHDTEIGGQHVNGFTNFTVDLDAPDRAPTVSSSLYDDDNRWHGGVGVPGTFTFGANSIGDIDHYKWGWSDPPTNAVVADSLGGGAAVSIAPTADGPRDLYVQSFDRAGNASEVTVYHFYVRPGSGPTAHWPLDGSVEDTAYLGDRDGELHGQAEYTDCAIGTCPRLDGSGAYISAPNALDTRDSFSVSAWVRLDGSRDVTRTVVSQDGADFGGFHLWYKPENDGRWVFDMADPRVPTTDMAWSEHQAQTGVWTHLTGVYDAVTNRMILYVNGVEAGSVERAGDPWSSEGPIQIGRGLWEGEHRHPWQGSIDEVAVYDRALTAAEVRFVVGDADVQLAHWGFDETEGTTADNAVPGGEQAVLDGGAQFTEDGHRDDEADGAVAFDGVSGHVSTAGPLVRTDQSFTVAAWVKLEDDRYARAIASQDGGPEASFAGLDLWYRPENGGRWVFGMANAETSYQGTDMAISEETAQIGEWVHVAGVYDEQEGLLRIYVNGHLAGTAGRSVESWNAGGPFRIGTTMWNGNARVDWWKGAIDEVRVYNRALDATEFEGIVSHSGVWLGNWPLDGDLTDLSGELHGEAAGDPDWTAGQSDIAVDSDLAIRLDGDGDHAELPVSVDPGLSFTVSAWARLDAAGEQVVLAQDGEHGSAYRLYATDDGKWAFGAAVSDTSGASEHRAVGTTAQIGVWTHLVGAYHAGSGQLLLYVNGVQAGTAEHAPPGDPFADGPTVIGAGHCAGAGCSRPAGLTGAVDDVVVYDRPLFAEEIRELAGRDQTLIHNWRFDESGGDSAADATGGRSGTLENGAAWKRGRVGNALGLDGVDDSAFTDGIDLRTDESFTVSAWVYLEDNDCDFSRWACRFDAVSLDGEHVSRFRLGHVRDLDQNYFGAWTFELAETDESGYPAMRASVDVEESELGTWVHLTGTYNGSTGAIRLYVNGELRDSNEATASWHGSGGLQFGRGLHDDEETHYWPGMVDEARLYTGALTHERVSAMYGSFPAENPSAVPPTGHAACWTFDEGDGGTAADTSGNGHDLAMLNGAEWVGGGRTGNAGWFDGASSAAEAPGPVIDTGRDFSAAAWVYLDNAGAGADRTVLSQDGERASSFMLQYDADSRRWAVAVPEADADDAATTVLTSTTPAISGRWTHLATTYDAETTQLRLYVNGVESGASVGTPLWDAAGPTVVGRAKWNGQPTGFFPRGVDDVQIFAETLHGGQIRAIHDDVPAVVHGYYRFEDDTARDHSWRGNDATVTGDASYTDGVSGRALVLDGESAGGDTGYLGMYTHDSLTVSGWARLDSGDATATVAGQDGARMSGFVLQYRPGLQRWVFGTHEQDADGSPMVYAASQARAEVGTWVHLAGVYDHPARELRLYVDGELAGTAEGVALWRAEGPFTLGHGKYDGAPAHHFPGAVDEIRVDLGVVPDGQIADRAGWPQTPGGQLGRFVDLDGRHHTGHTDDPALEDYHFEGTLGMTVPEGPNTRILYSCLYGEDPFSSPHADCEGYELLGEMGRVYTEAPTNLPTRPLYRCRDGGFDHFDSLDPDCEGAMTEGVLGHVLAYAPMHRYLLRDADHMSAVNGMQPGYVREGVQGVLPLSPQEGTHPVYACERRYGTDHFLSLESDCEGETVIGYQGELFAAPPIDVGSRPVYRCMTRGQYFVSTREDCEGLEFDRLLGHLPAAAPGTTPEFA